MMASSVNCPGAAQVCRIDSVVKVAGKETYEVSYTITSVPRERAGAALSEGRNPVTPGRL